MGFFDRLRSELIDIIEWIDDSKHTLVWRFPRHRNEIKNGAELIVRPGQKAIFVHRGEIADIFEPGHYTLKTDNLPILSTLQGWKHGFESPFKAECYFISTRQITDLKWGTPNPIMLRDPEFGPIRLRAFGTYAIQAENPKALLEQLVGTNAEFEVDELSELMRSIINTAFIDMIGESQIAALDIASRYQELSAKLREEVATKIDDEYGLAVPQLFIVNISLPEAVEKALDTRTSMGVIGDLGKFQQYQMGQAMTAAAENPSGGGAAEGMGLGMGFAMANQMFGAGGRPSGIANGGMAGAGAVPPPPPVGVYHVAISGQTFGPFTLQQLAQNPGGAPLSPQSMVWTPALGNWTLASKVPELATYLSVPPPPPAT